MNNFFDNIKKNLTIRNIIFVSLFTSSLILNINLFLNLGYTNFDKLLLSISAGSIQFLEVFFILKTKKYFTEHYHGIITHEGLRPWLTLVFKRIPGVFMFSCYLLATMVSLGASYSFSLYSIYRSNNKDVVLVLNTDKIINKRIDIENKQKQIDSYNSLSANNNNEITYENNATKIADYNNKIKESEDRISELNNKLRNAQDSLIGLDDKSDEFIKINSNIRIINSNITTEKTNITTYNKTITTLKTEDKANYDKAQTELQNIQRNFENKSEYLTKLSDEKSLLIDELNKLITEDEETKKENNKNQYQLIAENLTAILYHNKEETKVKVEGITEEQVRATLLAIFSLMMELGILMTSPREENEDDKTKIKSRVKLDKKTKIGNNKLKTKKELLKTDILKPNLNQIFNLKTGNKNITTDVLNPSLETKELPKVAQPAVADSITVKTEITKPTQHEKKLLKMESIEKEVEKMLSSKPTTVRKINA